jgi:transposase
MRKIREILRLKFAGFSPRQIAASLGHALSTIQEYLRRAAQASLSWPLPQDLDDARLEALLYPKQPRAIEIPAPDFAQIQRELSRPGVTRLLLWQEYKAQHPDGLQYTAFCVQYRQWLERGAEPVMRFEHRAGEKCFVDYAGQTVGIIDRHTGEIRQAQIFVAVLGCSNYTYAQASWTQTLPDWLGAHVRALEFFGGVPAAFVPDNLKSGVDRAHRYDPQLNRAYAEFAEHYGVAILPARVRKPHDKSKVETAVQIAQRQLIASHVRLFKRGVRATLDAHRPANHRAIIDTTIERLIARAEAIAPSVAQVLREQFNRKRHPEEALRVAQGRHPALSFGLLTPAARRCLRARHHPQSVQLPQRACVHPHAAIRTWRSSPVIPRARERARA